MDESKRVYIVASDDFTHGMYGVYSDSGIANLKMSLVRGKVHEYVVNKDAEYLINGLKPYLVRFLDRGFRVDEQAEFVEGIGRNGNPRESDYSVIAKSPEDALQIALLRKAEAQCA